MDYVVVSLLHYAILLLSRVGHYSSQGSLFPECLQNQAGSHKSVGTAPQQESDVRLGDLGLSDPMNISPRKAITKALCNTPPSAQGKVDGRKYPHALTHMRTRAFRQTLFFDGFLIFACWTE